MCLTLNWHIILVCLFSWFWVWHPRSSSRPRHLDDHFCGVTVMKYVTEVFKMTCYMFGHWLMCCTVWIVRACWHSRTFDTYRTRIPSPKNCEKFQHVPHSRELVLYFSGNEPLTLPYHQNGLWVPDILWGRKSDVATVAPLARCFGR